MHPRQFGYQKWNVLLREVSLKPKQSGTSYQRHGAVETQFAADEGLINILAVFIRRIIRNDQKRKNGDAG